VKQVGRWFARERRTQLLQLDPDGELEPDPEAQQKK
jgi:hypothetical protein